ASGGMLEFQSAVNAATASTFHIADVAGSTLKFDAAVGTGAINPIVTFDGGSGVLDLSSTTLADFHGVVAGFATSEGIKVAGAAAAVIDNAGTHLTVYDAGDNSLGTITLSSSYTGNQFNVSGNTIFLEDAPSLSVTVS